MGWGVSGSVECGEGYAGVTPGSYAKKYRIVSLEKCM